MHSTNPHNNVHKTSIAIMSFWIKLMVVHNLICLNRGVQRPISYSWQLASANAAWIIALTIAPGIFISSSQLPAECATPWLFFHSQPMLLRSVCISACSADQWAAFRFGESCEGHPSLFTNFFQWSPERKKLRMSIKPQGMSQFEGFFPWEAFQVVSPVISTIGSRINKSTVPTSRFWGSSPNPNIACQDFGSWIEEIMIVMCFYIHTHTYIRIHIRDKDTYQRERGERGS